MLLRTLLAATLTIGLVAPVSAAPPPKKPVAAAKKPAKKPVAAKKSVHNPAATAPEGPVVAEVSRPGGYMVPKEVILKNPTLAEREANAVWSLRAALNVAALQCQFSPFLKTVKNYNGFLQAHSEELARAQTAMIGHFRRTDGAKALNRFDEYTTRTYNSYSTLDAQYAFCNAAGIVGRRALAVPKGQLGAIALANGPAIRAALSYSPLSPALAVVMPDPVVLPNFAAM